MKIDGFGSSGKLGKTNQSKKKSKSGSASSVAKKPTPNEEDQIEVGNHEQTLDMIRSLVGNTPDVRVDEVERIMGELRGGKYKVNFEKVAEGFIKEAILNEMAKKGAKKS